MADETKPGDAATSSIPAPERPVQPAPGAGATQAAPTSKTKRMAVVGSHVKAGSDAVRNQIASAVWLLAVLAAIILAVGALLIALDANPDNSIVERVLDLARSIDGPFWKVFEFDRELKNGRLVPDETKEALVNWGLAAVAYLVVGRIADRVIRP